MKREFRAPVRQRLDEDKRKLPRNCSSDPASRRQISNTRSHYPIVVGGKTSWRSEEPGDLPKRRFFAVKRKRRNPWHKPRENLRGKVVSEHSMNLRVSSALVLRKRIGAFLFSHAARFIAFLSIVVLSGAASQTKSGGSDSLAQTLGDRTYALPEYVVSANRWQVRVQDLPSSATVLTAIDLLSSNGNSLADVLDGVPGLFLKSYGGPGSVTTTSLRGMGAEHTLVLIDGLRYNNVRDGQVDFGIFLLQNVDRIEVLRGGFSSVYGADAVGGIVNIITRRPGEKTNLKAEFTAGSYGLSGGNVNSSFNLGNVGLQLAVQREAGQGDYKFDFTDGLSSSVLRRQNSDYAINQVQLLTDFPFRPDLTLRVSSAYDWSERGSPGAVLSESSYNKARLRDAGYLTQASVDWLVQPALSIRLLSLFNAQHRQYADPLATGGPDDQQTDFADRTVSFSPLLHYILSSSTSVNFGTEYSHSTISSNQVASANRNQESIFLSSDHVIEFSRNIFYQVNLYPSVRYDHFSDVRGSVNPKLGVNLGVWRPWGMRVKSSFGSSFRVPTFNDLYWKNGGNPSLRPERSLSLDAGIAAAFDLIGPIELEANYFDITTKDRIIWTPDESGLWSPKNLQEVQSSGFELIAASHLAADHLVLRLSYSNAETRKTGGGSQDDPTLNKQLPYIPHETAAVSLAVRFGRVNANIHHTFTGYRFVTETNDPNFILSGYNKTDANFAVRIIEHPVSADARFEISNLFNTNYQLFPNFPMPLRTFAFRLIVEY
jgi:vitamin B12 transporter